MAGLSARRCKTDASPSNDWDQDKAGTLPTHPIPERGWLKLGGRPAAIASQQYQTLHWNDQREALGRENRQHTRFCVVRTGDHEKEQNDQDVMKKDHQPIVQTYIDKVHHLQS